MLEYIQGYSVIPIEILCCKIFFETFCKNKRKIKFLSNILFWGALCSLIYFFAILLNDFFIIKEICVINIIALMARYYWKITYIRSYSLAIIFQSLVLFADYVTATIDRSVLTYEPETGTGQALVILLSKTVLFLLVVLIRTLFKNQQLEYLEDIGWLKFLFFPMFTICIIAALISNSYFIENERQGQLFWMLAFGMTGLNIYLFYFIQDTAKRERMVQEKRIFEIEADNQLKLYESISASVEEQQKISHEYQNQLMCIQVLIQREEYKKLKEYIEEITGSVLQNLDYINTNNIIINAILNEKYKQAQEKGIAIVFKISDLTYISMKDQDVALLLSNLLNNAIEACQKCKNKKIIKCKLVLENNNMIISVRNTYDGNIRFVDGNYLTTKKQDTSKHGLGMKNMIQVIDNYGGIYSIRHTEKEFIFSIIIPQEKRKYSAEKG